MKIKEIIKDTEIALSLFFIAVASFGLGTKFFSHFFIPMPVKMSGKFLIQVEEKGQAWYVSPKNHNRYFLGDPDSAYWVLNQLKEDANTLDLKDIKEFSNTTENRFAGNKEKSKKFSGKILKALNSHLLWYVNPENLLRYSFSSPSETFALIQLLGTGISNEDLVQIPISKN